MPALIGDKPLTRAQIQARYNSSPKGRQTKARFRSTPEGNLKDRTRSAAWRAVHSEQTKPNFKNWYVGQSPEVRLVRNAWYSAKRRGLKFDIVAEDLLPLPTHCPILGLKLDYGCGGKLSPRDTSRYNQASLDRKDNSQGYVLGNVFVVSLRANQLKSDGTASELRALANWMEK